MFDFFARMAALAVALALVVAFAFSMAHAAAPSTDPLVRSGPTTRELVYEALRGEIDLQVQSINNYIAVQREMIFAQQTAALWLRAQACLTASEQANAWSAPLRRRGSRMWDAMQCERMLEEMEGE